MNPFKGLLMGLFFISVGISVDPVAAGTHIDQVLILLVVIILVKVIVFTLLAKLDQKVPELPLRPRLR
ncbi:hypothetical protein JCM19233_6647 [Vibrio astriarenae]|nr:hypothetical protein JCM19233_6647 [Vibrio sp. C7]